MHTIRIIGPGRAGTSLAAALSTRGWAFAGFLRPPRRPAGRRARRRRARDRHARRRHRRGGRRGARPSARHGGPAPLGLPRPRRRWPPTPAGRRCTRWCRCPTARSGAARLASGVTFAVAGDPWPRAMVEALGGRLVEVADEDRAAYHAAACIAANHVVALLGQVERVAASVGLDLEAFLPLARAAVDDVAALGARRRPHRPGRAGATGPRSAATSTRCPRTSAPATRPARRWRRRLAGRQRRRQPGPPAVYARRAGTGRCRRRRRRPGRRSTPSPSHALPGQLDAARARAPVGLVPTMGALHAGPPARSWRGPRAECDVVAVTIFVNPLQFGDPDDLADYPRTLERDLAACAEAGVDVVFAPDGGARCTRPGPSRRRPRSRCTG